MLIIGLLHIVIMYVSTNQNKDYRIVMRQYNNNNMFSKSSFSLFSC